MTIQEKAKAAIPLLQAVAEGKTLQYRMSDVCWSDCGLLPDELFKYPDRWRIKPEPEECWANEYLSGRVWHNSLEAAEKEKARNYIRTIHFRQAL